MVFPLLDINMQYIDAMPCAHFGPVHPFELNNSALSLHSYNIQPLTIPVPTKHNNKQIWPPVHKTIYDTFIANAFFGKAHIGLYIHSWLIRFMYSRWKQPQKGNRDVGLPPRVTVQILPHFDHLTYMAGL